MTLAPTDVHSLRKYIDAYHTTGYTRLDEPLPSWGEFHPIAFEKWLR